MKKFFKQNAKMLVIMLALVVLFPVLILTPSPWGFIPREVGIAIVGYGGSIIGGFLTLYGVWWTIDDNKNTRKKDLELQYCPVLSAEIIRPDKQIRTLCSEILVMHEHQGFKDNKPIYTQELIKLKNVGRGEIKQVSFQLNECKLMHTNNDSLTKEIKTDNSYILCDGACNFVPVGGEFYLLVGIPAIRGEFWQSLHKYYYSKLSISVDVSVQGVFTSDEQKYTLNFYVYTTATTDVRKHELDDMTFIKR